ncbi:hypothetical protein D3C85_604750 [compost metagenome]
MRRRVVLFHARDVLVVFAAGVGRGGSGQFARGAARWRRRWRHVVEETVVFVEHQQQDGLAPDLGIRRQRVEHAGRVVRALGGAGRAGVLGSGLGGADPRHLRQRAVQHVLAQQVQAAGGQRLVLQCRRGPGQVLVGVAVRLEPGGGVQRIVVRHVLVDAPAHAGAFQPFRIGGPGIGPGGIAAGELVVDVAQRRAVAPRQAIVGAAPEEQAVGIGAAGERAMVGVANGEGAGHRVLEGHVAFREVRHRMVLLGRRPVAHAAGVPGVLRVRPGVRRAGHAHGLVGLARIQPVRQHGARGAFVGLVVVLGPDGAMARFRAVRHGDGKAVAKTAHARQAAEIVVERAVFLHEDHDVLDIADRARAVVGGDGQRAADRRRKQGQRAGGARQGGAVA